MKNKKAKAEKAQSKKKQKVSDKDLEKAAGGGRRSGFAVASRSAA